PSEKPTILRNNRPIKYNSPLSRHGFRLKGASAVLLQYYHGSIRLLCFFQPIIPLNSVEILLIRPTAILQDFAQSFAARIKKGPAKAGPG
ncbi:MAG: hypothetical protein RQ753_05040, partial [Desulfurivibrionaceae bacterium]|nr:hypothetical protein [Desulfurivibrionaceae bacterium]